MNIHPNAMRGMHAGEGGTRRCEVAFCAGE